MPTYPVINKKTKETKTLSMTMKEYCDWKDENPDWDKRLVKRLCWNRYRV